ncbi:MAG: hypothetical protein ACMG55_19745 [Microcoleus sp.]
MFNKPSMPSKQELSALTDADLATKLKAARAALQEAKQLAKDSTEQEKVFSAFEDEQKRRSKNALKREAGIDED